MSRKKITLFIAFVLGVFSNVLIAQEKFETAIAYMEYINEQQTEVAKAMWEYTSAISHGKSIKKIEKRRKELLNTTSKSTSKIKELPAYDGDKTYRDSLARYMEMMHTILEEDYAKIVDMEAIADESYNQKEQFLLAKERANQKMSLAATMAENEQRKFALKHAINISNNTNKISQNLKVANQVITYYNRLYLTFLKPYYFEKELIEAIKTEDRETIESKRKQMLTYCDDAMQKVNNISSYEGDNSLRNSCVDLINFYKIESKSKISIIVDYYNRKDHYQQTKKEFDKTKESKRTKSDVNKYNKAVQDYNIGVNNYNVVNNELNNNRANALNNWNTIAQKFLDKHVP